MHIFVNLGIQNIVSIQCLANIGPLAKRHLNGISLAIFKNSDYKRLGQDAKWWSCCEFRTYVRYIPNLIQLQNDITYYYTYTGVSSVDFGTYRSDGSDGPLQTLSLDRAFAARIRANIRPFAPVDSC